MADAKLKDLKVTIGLSKKGMGQLNKDLRQVKAKFRNRFGEVGAMAQNFGRNMTLGVTAPLAMMGVQAVKAFDQQAKAIAQVEAGLKSTAGQVGYTSQQLQQMASDLQAKTLFGDEVILKDATAQLLTFTNISGDQFARTQKAALDLATRLDGDLKGASIQLGKALNDPIANLSALSRSGIQFSADQKEVIKSLTETGRLAEAQTIILDELEKQYGGSAEAAAKAGMGPFKQLSNTLGDLSEEFGKLINEMIVPLVPHVQRLVKGFQDLTDRQKKVALTVAAIAASAGPIMLLVSGLIKARGAMLALNVVMAANPLGAVVAGATLLIGAMAALKKSMKTTREETENFILRTKELEKEQQILALNTRRRALEEELANVKKAKAAEEAAAQVGAVGDKFEKQISRNNVGRYTSQIDDLSQAIIELKMATAEAQFGDGAVISLSGLPDPSESDEQGEAVVKNLQYVAAMQSKTAGAVENHALKNRGLKQSYDSLGQSLEPVIGRFRQLGMFVKDQLPAFFEGAFQALSQGTKSFGEFMLQTLQRLLIKAAALVATFAVLSVLMGGATGVAELTGGKAGLKFFMGAGMGIPQMSNGGLFTGASLAMIGEGPGTSAINPEVVAPLDKLQQMMGGGNVTVTGRLDGRDILISSERAGFDRNRVRGF
jgi:Tfp pilus assembly protein PilN